MARMSVLLKPLIKNGLNTMVIREQEPLNIEYPFRTLDGPITPNNQFFVRTHFPIPVIDESDMRLTVDGEVERELSLSYSDLLALPARTVVVLLECAGNGRAQLGAKAKGLRWESGAVGTAAWTGVPLSAVLEMAGVRNGGIVVAPPASPNDGLMDVIVIRNGTVLDLMAIVGNAILGDYLASEQVVHRQVKQLKLRSEPGMRFTLDGEVIDEEPVEFKIVPGAIRMFVGDEFIKRGGDDLAE